MTAMKLVIFGLTISSSWGNGHATLWRGLCRELALAGHHVVFFERDTPYYRGARDFHELQAGELFIYESWEDARERADLEVSDADALVVTSYCPDGPRAMALAALSTCRLKVFYDLDTPISLAQLEGGQQPAYIGEGGLAPFDLVLSFTGGAALELLESRLGARRVAALYGHVDPRVHRPVEPDRRFRCDMSYLGTYSEDRQRLVDELLLAPAALSPGRRFILGGPQYPDTLRLPLNLVHHAHVPPGEHAAFFCSSRMTLNVTRETMARLGYCPSGRLFEAAACGTPLVSDWFDGLAEFFEPGREIEIVRSRRDVLLALSMNDADLRARGKRARERVLAEHTARHRALELERLLLEAMDRAEELTAAAAAPLTARG